MSSLNSMQNESSSYLTDDRNQIYENLIIVNRKDSQIQISLTPPSSSGANATPATMAEVSSSLKKDAVLPEISSSIEDLLKNMNLPSDVLSFFNDTNQDSEQDNDRGDNTSRISTPESSYVEDEDHIYEQVCATEAAEHYYNEVTMYDNIGESNLQARCHSLLPTVAARTVQINELSLIESILNFESCGKFPQEFPEVLPQIPQRSQSLLKSTITDPPFRRSRSPSPGQLRQNYHETHSKEDKQCLPSHEDTVDGAKTILEPQPGPSRSNRTSVTAKLFNALKRKNNPRSKVRYRPVLEMIPKPLFTEQSISHQGSLLKFPNGLIVNMFNEWVPRSAVLSEKIIHTYQEPLKTQTKESLDLHFMLSLQNRVESKLNSDSEINMYCFEVVLALPKKEGSFTGMQQVVSNPNLITNYGDGKMLRQSHIFGVHKRSDRNLWMAKILQSVTDVFPETFLTEFTRAGWCYMKKSMSSSWSGAWLLLIKRKLYFFSYQDRQLQLLDLRKARCIGETDSDESIRNLYTEPGPSLFIDCPPHATLYFIMPSPRETQIWKKLIECTAHKNGSCLHSQQLTKNDVPVIIDKCINFIYAHGSMSEGIYRKSGSSSQVNKILQLFKEDAFAVQLTRAEFVDHDIAAALKKFIRDIPDCFFGSHTINLMTITSLESTEDKITSYKELLSQLPKIEYQTLKKLIGHLSFIASLETHNKMSIPNLAMIWGSTLMANRSQNAESEQNCFSNEANVMFDLIKLYKNLFPISPEEIKKEQLMLEVLQKYHVIAEDLSNPVKHSGDLKVWITIECNPETIGSAENEENIQINVTISPTKTASDICKELASKTPYQWHKLNLYEVICDGALTRPVHYSEKALEIVLKWSYWNEADRKSNYLAIRPTTTLNVVYRHIQQAPLLMPTTELKFADQQTKTLRSYTLQLIGQEIGVLKQSVSRKYEEVMTINLGAVHAYLGQEAKRDQSSLQWAITLVEHNFQKRTRDAPYIGHILGGTDFTEQILWYSSILHSLHPNDILPSHDLRPE